MLKDKTKVNAVSGVVLGVMLVASVVTLSLHDNAGNASTIVVLVGFIGTITMQAVGNAKSTDAAQQTREVRHEITNGLIPAKVNEALKSDDARAAISDAVSNGADTK